LPHPSPLQHSSPPNGTTSRTGRLQGGWSDRSSECRDQFARSSPRDSRLRRITHGL